MTGRGSLARRLEKLDEYLEFLGRYRGIGLDEFRSDELVSAAVERKLHLAIECVLDIGAELIASKGLREPGSYRDVILILGEAGVLPQEFASAFARVAGFRNVLVHDYAEVKPELVHRQLREGLGDLERFRDIIAGQL